MKLRWLVLGALGALLAPTFLAIAMALPSLLWIGALYLLTVFGG